MKRALVTGAGGFIGRFTLPLLVARGFEVHAVDRGPLATSDVEKHVLDLLDGHAVARLVASVRPTHVLHLAWCTTPGEFWNAQDNLDWVGSGVALVRALVDAGGGRFVGAGSCAEYDWSAGHCVEDETALSPATLYGTAKKALSELLFAEARLGTLEAAWGRVFLAYGPHEHPARLVPSVVRSLLRGERAACTHGEQLRDVMYVSDVAAAFVHLLDGDARGAFNVCSGAPIRLRTLVERLAEHLGRPDLPAFGALPERPGDPPVLTGAADRLRGCGFAPGVPLSAGIEETVAWWRRRSEERADA
jgi:nucleoside-diphosphate-sugar epimerase